MATETSEMEATAAPPDTLTWKDRGFVWLLWIWACVLGLGVGLFLGRLIGNPVSGTMFTFLSNFIGGIIIGTTVGFAQWLVLRNYFPREPFWMLANTAGWAIGWEVGWAVQDRLSSSLGSVAAWALAWAIIGAMVGLSGWFILRRHVRGAGWWIVASIVGGSIGGSIGGYVYTLAFEVMGMVGASRLAMLVAMISVFLGPGLAYGAVTGGVFALLVPRQRQR